VLAGRGKGREERVERKERGSMAKRECLHLKSKKNKGKKKKKKKKKRKKKKKKKKKKRKKIVETEEERDVYTGSYDGCYHFHTKGALQEEWCL